MWKWHAMRYDFFLLTQLFFYITIGQMSCHVLKQNGYKIWNDFFSFFVSQLYFRPQKTFYLFLRNRFLQNSKTLSVLQRNFYNNITTLCYFILELSNGHLPQIRKNGKLLGRMCRMRVTFFQKWPLANVGESGESEQNRLANVGKFIESEQNRLANAGASKIGCFMHK